VALGANLTLPRVYESIAHLEESRALYARGLDRVLDAPADTASPVRKPRSPNRAGRISTSPTRDATIASCSGVTGKVLDRVLRPLLPQFFEPRRAPARDRVRVGFCSHFFFNCVVGRYFASWITDIDKSRFEVFAYYSNETIAEDTRTIAAAADVFRHVSGKPLAAIAREIAADALDVLVYPELECIPRPSRWRHCGWLPCSAPAGDIPPRPGSGPSTGSSRRARWSRRRRSALSERLARLPGLGTRYALPPGDAAPAERSRIGVPRTARRTSSRNRSSRSIPATTSSSPRSCRAIPRAWR
jgi:hypothetical protein